MGGGGSFPAFVDFRRRFCWLSLVGWTVLAKLRGAGYPMLHLHYLQFDCHDCTFDFHERFFGGDLSHSLGCMGRIATLAGNFLRVLGLVLGCCRPRVQWILLGSLICRRLELIHDQINHHPDPRTLR